MRGNTWRHISADVLIIFVGCFLLDYFFPNLQSGAVFLICVIFGNLVAKIGFFEFK